MALMALMGQIGPKLKDYAGDYEFYPEPPAPLTAESVLKVLDDDTIEWTNTSNGSRAVYERSTKKPDEFVGVGSTAAKGGCCAGPKYNSDGDVWVLSDSRQPLGFRPATATATSEPTHTARRTDQDLDNPSTAAANQGAGGYTESTMAALERKAAKMTPAMQERASREAAEAEKKAAEMALIKETITNDRESQKEKKKLSA